MKKPKKIIMPRKPKKPVAPVRFYDQYDFYINKLSSKEMGEEKLVMLAGFGDPTIFVLDSISKETINKEELVISSDGELMYKLKEKAPNTEYDYELEEYNTAITAYRKAKKIYDDKMAKLAPKIAQYKADDIAWRKIQIQKDMERAKKELMELNHAEANL